MRFLKGFIAISALLVLASRADAIGRMPGHTLQFLGWGYGEGYHAPIMHIHRPVHGAVLHAPGVHWVTNHLHPVPLPPHYHGGRHFHPHYFGGPAPAPFHPVHPVESAPPEPVELDAQPDLPVAPAPPMLEDEVLPGPEGTSARSMRRG